MALPPNIKKVKLPNNDVYEIIPERLQKDGYELKPPTLTQDSTIALTSDIPPQEMYWCTYGTTTYAQISQALSDGKVPMIKYNGITYMYSKDWGSSLGHLFGTMDGNFARWVYCKQNSTWGTGYMEVENSVNKTTTISSASTNVQYPSAKAVWDALPTDTNQKVKTGNVTFGADDVVDFVAGSNVSISGDETNKTITINSTASSVKTLNTTATLSQSTSSNESISGTGTITLHKISKTGSYGDLLNKPTYSSMPYGSTTKYIIYGSSGTSSNPIPFIGSGQCYIQQDGGSTYLYSNNKQVLTSHQYIKSLNTNNSTEQTVSTSEAINGSGTISLHKISKTGKYSDLIDTPTIPANTSDLNNDSGFITASDIPSIPTKTSDLTNDSGFIIGITSNDVTTALGYTPYNSSNPNGYTSNAGTVTSITINTSGTGLSGGSSTAITTSGSRTITLKSSANGNASSTDYPVVLRNATGSIQTEKLAISSGTTTKATLQYTTSTNSIDFIFN